MLKNKQKRKKAGAIVQPLICVLPVGYGTQVLWLTIICETMDCMDSMDIMDDGIFCPSSPSSPILFI